MTCFELIRKLRLPSVLDNKLAYPKSWYLQGFYSNWENGKCPLTEFHLYQFHSECDKSIQYSSFTKNWLKMDEYMGTVTGLPSSAMKKSRLS